MNAQEMLTVQSIRRAVQLEGLKQGEVNKFAKFLKEMDVLLRARLSTDELTTFKRGRLESLLKEINVSLGNIFDANMKQLLDSMDNIAVSEAKFEAKSLQLAIGSSATVALPVLDEVKKSILSAPLSVRGADGGKLLEQAVADFTTTEKQRIVGAIRQGVFEGQTNSEIIQKLRGTRANQFKDGILDITSRNAEAIVRTGIAHVATTARNETFKANSDIVDMVKWQSTLDGRTSEICRSLSGMVFKLYEGIRPPAHWRCRSTIVAVLNDAYAFLSRGGQQSSMNGTVDANLTYYEWLKTQPIEFQDSVIGVKRGNLLRDGGLSADTFAKLQLDKNFQPLTLDDMRRLEPLAFKHASI